MDALPSAAWCLRSFSVGEDVFVKHRPRSTGTEALFLLLVASEPDTPFMPLHCYHYTALWGGSTLSKNQCKQQSGTFALTYGTQTFCPLGGGVKVHSHASWFQSSSCLEKRPTTRATHGTVLGFGLTSCTGQVLVSGAQPRPGSSTGHFWGFSLASGQGQILLWSLSLLQELPLRVGISG